MKTMNKSRVAFLVCLLVLALALTSILALNVFAEDEVATEWTGYSLVLTDGTDIVLKGTLSADHENDADDYYVSYDFCEGENIRVDFLTNADGSFEVPIRVAHGQMNDTITARIIVDGETIDTVEASVKNYCATILNDEFIVGADEVADGEDAPTENTAEMKTLVSELLRYGAAAYNYLGETEEATALLEGLTLTEALVFPENPAYVYEVTTEIADGTTTIKGVSVVDIDSMKLTLDNYLTITYGTTANIEETVNYLNLDEEGNIVSTITFASFFNYADLWVTEANAGGYEVSEHVKISPSYYAYAMKDDAEVGDLVKALYNCAIAVHNTIGHTYVEEIVTPATCQADGVSIKACVCGLSEEVEVPSNDNHVEIELINGNGGFVGYKCTACDELWATVDGIQTYDGTDDSYTGIAGVEAVFSGASHPVINEGRYEWIRMEGASKDQNQLWYNLGSTDAVKAENDAKFILSVDLEPIGVPTDAKSERSIMEFKIVTDRNQQIDRWGPSHNIQIGVIRWLDDNRLLGWNDIEVGTVAAAGEVTNVTVVITFGEEEVDGETVPMIYATYYINGEGVCTTGVENTLLYGGFGAIYQNGYTTEDFTGYAFDNLWFGWTNGDITVQEMASCGAIKYIDAGGALQEGGAHEWVDTVIKEPTCAETGEKAQACSCGAAKASVAIPKLPHTYDYETGATVTETTLTYTCTACEEDIVYDALGIIDFSETSKPANSLGNFTYVNADSTAKELDVSAGYAKIVDTFNTATFGNNIFFQLQAAGKFTLEDNNKFVVGFDLAMPEEGFPATGVVLQGKIGGWGNGANLLLFKDNAVSANGTKVADLAANEWHNYVLEAVIDGQTVKYTVYMDGAQVASFTQTSASVTVPTDGFANGNCYLQLNIARNDSNATAAGMLVDNLFVAAELSDAFGHTCVAGEYEVTDTDHTQKCSICGVTLVSAEHAYEYTTTKEATCAEAGSKVGTCVCGKTVTETLPQLAHTIALDTENSVFGTVAEHTGAHAPESKLVYACADCDYSYTIEGKVRDFNDGCACGGLQNNYTEYPTDYTNGYAAVTGAFTTVAGTHNVYFQIEAANIGFTAANPYVLVFGFDLAMPTDGFSETGIALNGKLGGWANNGNIVGFKDGKFLANNAEIATLAAEEWHNYVISVVLSDVTADGYTANYNVYMDGKLVSTFVRANTGAIAETGFNTTSNWYFQLNIAGNASNVSTTKGMWVDNLFMANTIALEHTCIAGEHIDDATGHYDVCLICGDAMNKTAHSFTADTTALEEGDHSATHFASGVITYACADCEYSYSLDAAAAVTFSDCHCGRLQETLGAEHTSQYTMENGIFSIVDGFDKVNYGNNFYLQIQPDLVSAQDTFVLAFDLAMPEGGFPTTGLQIQNKVISWPAGAKPLAFQNNSVLANGTKVLDLAANEWHNYALVGVINGGQIDWDLYIDGVKVTSFAQVVVADGVIAGNWSSANVYFQINVACNGNEAGTNNGGFMIDNIVYGVADPFAVVEDAE